MDKPRTIVFFAYPCGGKDKHSRMLIDFFKEKLESFLYIGTGEIFRNLKKNNYTSKLINDSIEKGELLPNFLSESIVGKDLIKSFSKRKHLIINGFPRNLQQAKTLLEMTNFYKREVDVVFIKISQKEALKRLLKRTERLDDSTETIKRRFKIFRKKKTSLIPFFRKNFNLIEINGNGTAKEVHEKIIEALGFNIESDDLLSLK